MWGHSQTRVLQLPQFGHFGGWVTPTSPGRYRLFSREEQVQILLGNVAGLDWMSYTSLGNPDGRLYGIRAEKLVLSFGEKHVVHNNIFVGINMDEFSGAYEGLIPPCLLEEE